jgi:iron complex outermembrane recepter protein
MTSRKDSLGVILGAVIAFGGGLTQAQQAVAPSDSAMLEEVVVTARYRSEDLQKTPISIVSLSAETLEARGITDLVQVTQAAPNVTFAPGGPKSGNAAVLYIRGVGQFDSSYTLEPGVGVYFDGVYDQTLAGTQVSLGDIGSIEILRGPQGTLFGKNTEGGAVLISPVEPKGDDSAYIDAGYGSFNRRQLKAAFDLALIPSDLFLRVSFGSQNQDGYVKLEDWVCLHPGAANANLKATTPSSGSCVVGTEGSLDDQTGRVALKWLPNENATVNLSVDWGQQNDGGPPDVMVGIPNPHFFDGLNASFFVPTYGVAMSTANFYNPSHYVSYQNFTDALYGLSVPNVQTNRTWGTTLKFDYVLPFDMKFTSISNYSHQSGENDDVEGESPLPISFGLQVRNHYQISEEDRISGTTFGGALEWTAGGYYAYGRSLLGGFYDITVFDFPYSVNDVMVSRSEAGFLHGLYHVSDKFSIEAGVRYSHDYKSYTFGHQLIPVGGNPDAPVFPRTTGIAESSRVDPKVAIQYQWTSQLMTYAQVSTGYKAGGLNPFPNDAAQVLPFRPETLLAYEVGIKSQWLDNRLRVNADVYLNDLRELQLQIFDLSLGLGGVESNAGHAHILGWEADIMATPVRDLQLDASVGYTHFKYLELGDAALTPANAGGLVLSDVNAYTPTWKFNLGAQYTAHMAGYGSLTPRLDYVWQSLINFDAQNESYAAQGAYGLLNAHLTWATEDSKWSSTFEILNATNKFYWANMFDLSADFGTLHGYPGMPRTFFGSVKRRF